MNPPIDSAAVLQCPVPPPLSNGATDHDDWEYEYDEQETEDVYFTLDLTSHVPNALVQEPFFQASGPESDNSSGSTIQITDLHTDHPVVRLDDGVYTCTWTTDLGTQFHISEAGTTERPHRPGTVLDIVGTSRTRLLGRPVELQPRAGLSKSANGDNSVSDAVMVDDEYESEAERDDLSEPLSPGLQTAPGQQLHIPRELCKDSAGEAQATFLERLSEIKLKKGEKDVIPIYSVRSYDPPRNANVLRQEGLAADNERARLSKDAQLTAISQRPQKRRRRMTYAEKGIPTRDIGHPDSQTREFMSRSLVLQPEQSAGTIQAATGEEHTQTGDSGPEAAASGAGAIPSASTSQPPSLPEPITAPANSTSATADASGEDDGSQSSSERFDGDYVATHPNETFHHRGRGQWVRGLPPPGLNPKMKVAVRGPGAQEWSALVAAQKTVESESEDDSD